MELVQIEYLLIAVGGLLLVELWRSRGRLLRYVARGPQSKPLETYPSVTVIRPIRGLDAGAKENIDAALDHGYPGDVETLFVLDDATEPAVPLIRKAISVRGYPEDGDARIVLCGHPPSGRTGKLHAMITALRQSNNEIVVFADSDIRPDDKGLRVLIETLVNDPKAGAAFAPVVVSEPPQTVGDAGYALMLNGLYGPAAAAAAAERGGTLPFIMGQFMAFRREALEAIGGLETAEGQLVDDMYIGARIASAGYNNRISERSVPIVQFGMTTAGFAATYRRWIAFSRTGLPGWSFKRTSIEQGLIFWVGLLAAVAAVSQGWWLAAILNAAAPLGIGLVTNELHSKIGGGHLSWRHRWVSVGLMLVAPVVYLSIFAHHEVNWRGRSYSLDGGSYLAEGSKLEASEGLASRPHPELQHHAS